MSLDEQKNLPLSDSPEEDNPLSSFEQVNDVSEKKKVGKLESFLVTGKGIATTITSALLLVGVIILLLVWNPFATTEETVDPDTDVSETEDTTITVLDKTKKNTVVVNRVDITNTEDTFSILYNKKDKVFYLDGYKDIQLSTDMTDLLQEFTSKLTAIDTVEKASSLKDFGLDKPAATATITYTDGSKAILYVGNQTPGENGYYVRVDKDDTVYIFDTDSVLPFTYPKTTFADITLIASPTVKSTDTNGTVVLKEVSYKGKNYPEPLLLRRSYLSDGEELTLFSYIIEKPYPRGTTDAVGSMLGSFKSLYAEQALVLHPTDKEKTALGFDDPLAEITITLTVETGDTSNEDESDDTIYYNSVTTNVAIGSLDNENYVVMVDGIDAIYLVTKSAFSGIADRTYKNSVNTLLFLKNITNIGHITVTTNDGVTDFQLTHYPKKEDADEQLKVTVNDKRYDTADFRELYQILMSLERYGESDADPKGEPVMTVNTYLNDGSLYIQAEYYSLDGNLCLVKTAEGEVFTTRWAIVTHFMEQIENYLNGNKVVLLT